MKIGDIVKMNTEPLRDATGELPAQLLFLESWIGIVTAVLQPIYDEPLVLVQWSHMAKPNKRTVSQLKLVKPERR